MLKKLVIVSLASRRTKRMYQLIWTDPETRKRKIKSIGGDKRRAEREALILEQSIEDGTYTTIRRTGWAMFVADHVSKIPGVRNRAETKRTLDEFGLICRPSKPTDVSFRMLEKYIEHCRSTITDETGKITHKPNKVATINRKLRELRATLNRGVERGYIARNPFTKSLRQREDQKVVRIVSAIEEMALLGSADCLYGFRWRSFIAVALATGGRRGELLSLLWGNVDFTDRTLTFTVTKGKKDRIVFRSM